MASKAAKAAASGQGQSAAVTLLLIFLWYSSSLVAITTSKMTMERLKVPLVLCSVQFLTATLVSGSTLALQRKGLSPGTQGLMVLGGIAVTYTLGFFFTNLAFSLAHASFVETVKAGEPISTVILALALLGERERVATYASLLPVVVGVALASSGEAGGSLAAFVATVASNFGFSARAVFAKQLKRDFPKSPAAASDVSLFFHISWMGLLGLVPFALASEVRPLQAALASPVFQASRFFGVMAVNGLMYTAYNQFSFMVLSRVSTATHAVLNVCRRVCVIGVTTFVFGIPLTSVNCAGIVVAVAGMCWFTYTKTRAAATIKKE